MKNTPLRRVLLSRPPFCTTSPTVMKQGGFSFLELLISLFIFAIGFLGLAALQTLSFKMTHDNVLQASAVSLSSALVEQFKVTGDRFDLAQWKLMAATELPNGTLELSQQSDHYHLKVAWQESQHSHNASDMQYYELKFRVNN